MRNHRKTRQVEFLNKAGRIVREGIEVITIGWLVGPAVPPSVETDTPKSPFREGNDLVVPHLTVAAKAVQKENWFSLAPLPPEQLGTIFRCNVGHFGYLLSTKDWTPLLSARIGSQIVMSRVCCSTRG